MPLEQFPGQLRVDDVETPGRTLQQKAQQYQPPVLLTEQIAQASEFHHPNLRRKPVEPGDTTSRVTTTVTFTPISAHSHT